MCNNNSHAFIKKFTYKIINQKSRNTHLKHLLHIQYKYNGLTRFILQLIFEAPRYFFLSILLFYYCKYVDINALYINMAALKKKRTNLSCFCF